MPYPVCLHHHHHPQNPTVCSAHLFAGHKDVGDLVVLTHNWYVGDDVNWGDVAGKDADAAGRTEQAQAGDARYCWERRGCSTLARNQQQLQDRQAGSSCCGEMRHCMLGSSATWAAAPSRRISDADWAQHTTAVCPLLLLLSTHSPFCVFPNGLDHLLDAALELLALGGTLRELEHLLAQLLVC